MPDDPIDLTPLDPDADPGAEDRFVRAVMSRVAARASSHPVRVDPLWGAWSLARPVLIAASVAILIAGVSIPQGANLLLALCSGNRDDAHFPEPERFDLDRANAKTHLSFGFGIHYCLGAPLARLELTVILEELTRRMPSLRVVPDQKWEFPPNTSFRGPARLFVEW